MKLYYFSNACSMGIHLLLHEIGTPFAIETVDFTQAAQYQPTFMAMNPKSKVPLLQRDDGGFVSEFPAIAYYIARANPAARLLPNSLEGEVKALELLDYMVATMHMRGFTRIFRPNYFTNHEAQYEEVKQAGVEIVRKGFALLEPVLGAQEFMLGDFSIVEGALFFLEHWSRFRAQIAMPANFEAHLDRLLARPAARKTLAAEGIAEGLA
ncbi:MAG: glutathione S-transferase N-terminal domain-containing protein [Acidocella sp.]|nr:glutathione S-transferase N-terminal domain-containing protein [Acidocella sp.]